MDSIAFIEPMVMAIIEGRKPVTRRPVRGIGGLDVWYATSAKLENPPIWFDFILNDGMLKRIKAPYRKGDVVYVNEDKNFLLEIVSVIPERLQEINAREIVREGYPVQNFPELSEDDKKIIRNCGAPDLAIATHPSIRNMKNESPRDWFVNVWDSIYSKTYPWASNPWVWRIEFRVMKG